MLAQTELVLWPFARLRSGIQAVFGYTHLQIVQIDIKLFV